MTRPWSLPQWDAEHVDLVTVRLRVTLTDPQAVLSAWRARDPSLAESMSGEPELSLTMAVQDAVKPPRPVRGARHGASAAGGLFASVRAEPSQEGLDPW